MWISYQGKGKLEQLKMLEVFVNETKYQFMQKKCIIVSITT